MCIDRIKPYALLTISKLVIMTCLLTTLHACVNPVAAALIEERSVRVLSSKNLSLLVVAIECSMLNACSCTGSKFSKNLFSQVSLETSSVTCTRFEHVLCRVGSSYPSQRIFWAKTGLPVSDKLNFNNNYSSDFRSVIIGITPDMQCSLLT